MILNTIEKWVPLLAPLLFAASMFVIAPYLAEVRALSGTEAARLTSIRNQNAYWVWSHILMAVGAGLYIPAFFRILAPAVQARPVFGRIVRLICITGAIGLVGQMSLDLALGVLSKQSDLAAMTSLMEAIENEPAIDWMFFTIANLSFIFGFLLLSIYSLISDTIPRATGALILAGWLVIILLGGTLPFNQAIGHTFIACGFLVAFLRMNRDDPVPGP